MAGSAEARSGGDSVRLVHHLSETLELYCVLLIVDNTQEGISNSNNIATIILVL